MYLAISVANLMSKATALLMGKSVVNVMVIITSKPFAILRLQQSSQDRAHPSQEEADSTTTKEDIHREQQWQWQWRQAVSKEEDAQEAAKAENISGDVQKLGPISN